MKTFPVAAETDERVVAFEIDSVYVSRRTIAKLLKQIEGVADIRLGGRFGSSNDIRVEFKYLDRDYIVWEPFGDNSRYWVGPRDLRERVTHIDELQAAFGRYKPPFHRALLGDLLTLRLFQRVFGRC